MFKQIKFLLFLLATTSLFFTCGKDEPDPDPVVTITGLDISISADSNTPNLVTVTPSATNATAFAVDFGDPNSSTDVLTTSGSAVSYTYPEETATYTITATASATNAEDVTVSKDYTVMVVTVDMGDNADIVGTWRLAASAGAFGVGPARGSTEWFTSSADDVTGRACLFDDEYVFGEDAVFQNVMDGSTWVEGWQGNDPEGCAAPVAPHDGSTAGMFLLDKAAGTLVIDGNGSFMGLAKAYNGGELTSPSEAVDQITYQASLSDDDQVMTLEIEITGGGWWTFNFWKDGFVPEPTDNNDMVAGSWVMAPQAGAFGVGPARGSTEWFTSGAGDVTTRACFFDDEYVMNEDGSFQNVMGDATWLEPWQGSDPESCGTPIAPHDGSGAATYVFNATDGTLTVSGNGAFMGLAKAINGSELTSPSEAADEIVYQATLSDDMNSMMLEIEIAGGGWWTFNMIRKGTGDGGGGGDDCTDATGITGSWKMSPVAGSLAVGPERGSSEWFSINADQVNQRACFYDDEYVFNDDGSFQNLLGDMSWIEPWQGNDPESCNAPVAPHDGSASTTYMYDESAGSITLSGKGAYLGIPKATNNGELASPNDAPDSVTYLVSFSEDNCTMTVEIDFGGGWWTFLLARQ